MYGNSQNHTLSLPVVFHVHLYHVPVTRTAYPVYTRNG